MFATVVILLNIYSIPLFESFFVRVDISVSQCIFQRAKVNDTGNRENKVTAQQTFAVIFFFHK